MIGWLARKGPNGWAHKWSIWVGTANATFIVIWLVVWFALGLKAWMGAYVPAAFIQWMGFAWIPGSGAHMFLAAISTRQFVDDMHALNAKADADMGAILDEARAHLLAAWDPDAEAPTLAPPPVH